MAIKTDEIPFVIGQKVTATIRGEVFSVCIRGWLKGQYVITDLPRVGGDVYRVAPQTGVQIHFIKDGLFVNFKSSASYALAQAISLLVIEYPRTSDMHNLRKFERFRSNIPVTFFYEEGDKKFEDSGVIRDISSGGALISHRKLVGKQNLLYITAELPAGGSFKLQKVGVKNLRKNPKSGSSPYVTGVKWNDLLPESEEGLSKFISQRSREKREGRR
ncbi:MAG: flagellar brake domain-containing protein [Nitrospinae bacterium]|nr:flagellar brake domain-containing protein [Nitrospinota bacterium]MBL7018985.1 flagellar brake domain-containing protein [Nitrospinaceae bacterium]